MKLKELGIIEPSGKQWIPSKAYRERSANGGFYLKWPDQNVMVDGHPISSAALDMCYFREVAQLITLLDLCDSISYGALAYMDDYGEEDYPFDWVAPVDTLVGCIVEIASRCLNKLADTEIDMELLLKTDAELKEEAEL